MDCMVRLFNKITKHKVALRIRLFSADNWRNICLAKIIHRMPKQVLNPKGRMLNMSRNAPPKKANTTDHPKLKKDASITKTAKIVSGFTLRMRKQLNSVESKKAIISNIKSAYICWRNLPRRFKEKLLERRFPKITCK